MKLITNKSVLIIEILVTKALQIGRFKQMKNIIFTIKLLLMFYCKSSPYCFCLIHYVYRLHFALTLLFSGCTINMTWSGDGFCLKPDISLSWFIENLLHAKVMGNKNTLTILVGSAERVNQVRRISQYDSSDFLRK